MLTRLQTIFKRSLFLYFIVFIHTAYLPAKIIDVPTASNPNIQSGIDTAQDGDTVLVQPGIYKEKIDFSGKNITVSSLYLINKERQYIRQTILDGDQKDRVVIINKNEDSLAILCGFTITNANTPYSGGGVYCANSHPSLKSLIITKNKAYRGGALHCYGANPILEDVKIYNNIADNVGGGISMVNSNPRLYNVSIFKNLAKFNGGGINAENSKPNFDETNLCNIYGNIAFFVGEDINTDSLIDVTVDTFTVLEPTYIHVSPLKLINLSILNSYFIQRHADLYVSPSGSNENGGLSENDPLRTIGHAMRIIQSDSLNPRKVYLAEGVYSSETNGEYFPVKCVNYVSIIGNIENSHNSYGVVNSVVDANRQNHVVHISNLKDIQLRNLIIQNSGESWKAGGIYCQGSNLEIKNLLIRNNISDEIGGGIYVQNSTILISNSQIYENFAKSGGGIFCKGSDIFMKNVRIKNNSSNGRGAGIRFWSSHAEFEQVSIHDNYIIGVASNLHGGGIYSYNSNLYFNKEARCNIYSNTSGSHNGYDIYCDNLVTVDLDTFTVLQPTELYASPISNFTFDILHTLSHGIIHVPTSTHPTIQSGIDAAQDGDTVLVQPGIYKENLDMKGKNIVLTSLYLLENDPDYILATTIDGDGKWCVINYNDRENVTCELNGFTLTNGIGVEHSWDNSRLGGAIYCQEASPSFRNLIITENQARLGSGIYCSRSSPIIENVTISKNTGSHGTIHCNTSGTPIISNVIINENHDYGLYIKADPIISKTIITKNSRGGVYVKGSAKFYDVLIANNKYLGIASDNSSIRLENTTVAYNGGGMSNVHSYTFIKNCIFWDNTEKQIRLYQYMSGESRADIEYSNIKGGRHGITGWSGYQITINYDSTNINSDPLFCDPLNGIYTLAENSPCIGTASDGGNMGALEVDCTEGVSSAAPEWVSTFSDDYKILLKWHAIKNPALSGYNIYAGTSIPNTLIATTTSVLDTTIEFSILDLFYMIPFDSLLYFQITPYYSLGRVGLTSKVREVPIILHLNVIDYTVEDTQFFLKWNKIRNERISGYKIYIGRSPETDFLLSTIPNSTDTLFTINLIDVHHVYKFNSSLYFRVVAYDQKGTEFHTSMIIPLSLNLAIIDVTDHYVENSGVYIKWHRVDNYRISGYHIYAGKTSTSDSLLTSISSRVDTSFSIDIIDLYHTLLFDSTVYFRISGYDSSGVEFYSSPKISFNIEIGDQFRQIPTNLTLYQNYPNPFNNSTVIVYFLPEKEQVTLTLYDLRGARVKRLFSGLQESGFHRVEWDGRNDQGNSTAQGLYIYQLKTSIEFLHRKLILLK